MVEKYYNENGEVGVLVSYGFGAGWSTWNSLAIAYDKRVIEKWLSGASELQMKEYLESIGYGDVYTGGYKQLQLEFVPCEKRFYIKEHDGSESLVFEEDIPFVVF